MKRLVSFGVPKRIVSFVMPLGYSFNLDGSTLYLAVASVFVAQAAGVDLSFGQQITMMLMLMLTSKGMAGIPRASQVIHADDDEDSFEGKVEANEGACEDDLRGSGDASHALTGEHQHEHHGDLLTKREIHPGGLSHEDRGDCQI